MVVLVELRHNKHVEPVDMALGDRAADVLLVLVDRGRVDQSVARVERVEDGVKGPKPWLHGVRAEPNARHAVSIGEDLSGQ